MRELSNRLLCFYNQLSKHLKFVCDDEFGFLSVDPAHVGPALEVSVVANLPSLANNYNKLKILCNSYDIIVRRQRQFLFELSSTKKLGLSEFQIIVKFFNGIREVLEYEYSSH